MTVIPFALLGAAYVIDQAARDLVADVKLAMKRSDLTLDFVSRVIGVPTNKLSDQLNGKLAFTSFWRFTASELREAGFWVELLDIRARRVDRVLMRSDLATLVGLVEQLVQERKHMAKASLSTAMDAEAAS